MNNVLNAILRRRQTADFKFSLKYLFVAVFLCAVIVLLIQYPGSVAQRFSDAITKNDIHLADEMLSNGSIYKSNFASRGSVEDVEVQFSRTSFWDHVCLRRKLRLTYNWLGRHTVDFEVNFWTIKETSRDYDNRRISY